MRSLKVRVSAGVVDAGLSSLQGFAIGLAATTMLDPASLGVYAVFYSACQLAMALPHELVLGPAELAVVSLPEQKRLAALPRSLRVGMLPALLGGLLTLIAVPVTAGVTSADTILALAIPTVVAAALGPPEEHIRRMLHLDGRSLAAVAAATAMLVASGVVIFGLLLTPIDRVWIPQTALAAGNLASLITGLLLARSGFVGRASGLDIRLRTLVRTGRWMLVQGATPMVSLFVASALVTRLAGPEYLGYAEAARTVSQPVIVLGLGLLRVLGPRSVEAGLSQSADWGRRNARMYRLLLFGGTALYMALVGWDWSLNPFALLVPAAYVMPGLVLLTAAGNALNSSVFPERSELWGGGKAPVVAAIESTTSLLTVAVAATAGWTLAYARPLGRLFQGVGNVIAYRRQLGRMYIKDGGRQTADGGEEHGTGALEVGEKAEVTGR
jgi:hypothetical protein